MPEPAIRVEGLRKRFGDVVALDGVDFEVPPATVFGLLGPNGAGKTTAVRVLTTILRPDAGQATVLEHRLQAAKHPRRAVAVLPDPVDEIGTWQVQLRGRYRPTFVLKEVPGVRAQDLFQLPQ